MATHSSTLAWKIPWAEEPVKLQCHGVAKSRTRLNDFPTLSISLLLFMHIKEASNLLTTVLKAQDGKNDQKGFNFLLEKVPL